MASKKVRSPAPGGASIRTNPRAGLFRPGNPLHHRIQFVAPLDDRARCRRVCWRGQRLSARFDLAGGDTLERFRDEERRRVVLRASMSQLLPHDAPGGCEQRRNRAGRQRALAGAAGGPAQRAEPVCLDPLVVAAEPVVHQRRHARDAQRGHARRRLRAPSMAALVEEGTRPETAPGRRWQGRWPGRRLRRDEPIQDEFESSGHDASPAALLRGRDAARSAPTASARNALETLAFPRCSQTGWCRNFV